MRIREYLDKATAYIADPGKAHQVRLELQGHLEEALAEATREGLDAETAELVAVGRMGSPDVLARQLGAAHHSHLPWRIYLSPLPALGLLALPDKFALWINLSLWAALCFTLMPSRVTLKRWLMLLYTDCLAKHQWLNRQPLRKTLVTGAVGGFAAGMAFSSLPVINDLMYSNGWYAQVVPVALWHLLGSLSWMVLLLPLVIGSIVVLVARRFHKGNWVLTAAFAALAFPVGSLPSLWWWLGIDGATIWLFFVVTYALAALLGGYGAQAMQRRKLPVEN